MKEWSNEMKHYGYETKKRRKQLFFKEPESFTKFSDRNILSFALGACLYMPSLKETIANDIIEVKFPELTSLVIDLEDAVGDSQLEDAEKKLYEHVKLIYLAIEGQRISFEDLPLIFIRVRDPIQMERVTTNLGILQRVITGYVFPKFSYEAGLKYLEILQKSNTDDIVLYGMPILESPDILYKESRFETLLELKHLIDAYKPLILNIRVGATDFCGLFGIRRNVDSTIYDVSIIRDCITDIINVFNRRMDGYVLSGPVWEYFSKDRRILKPQLRITPFQEKYGRTGLEKREELINEYTDGLIKELLLDKLNGMIGKTIIHPTHIKPVHALYTVTHEEYLDALSIISQSDGEVGVFKSQYKNKMNEVKPHYHWAAQILQRAKVFGVLNEDQDFTNLMIEKREEQIVNEVRK